MVAFGLAAATRAYPPFSSVMIAWSAARSRPGMRQAASDPLPMVRTPGPTGFVWCSNSRYGMSGKALRGWLNTTPGGSALHHTSQIALLVTLQHHEEQRVPPFPTIPRHRTGEFFNGFVDVP